MWTSTRTASRYPSRSTSVSATIEGAQLLDGSLTEGQPLIVGIANSNAEHGVHWDFDVPGPRAAPSEFANTTNPEMRPFVPFLTFPFRLRKGSLSQLSVALARASRRSCTSWVS